MVAQYASNHVFWPKPAKARGFFPAAGGVVNQLDGAESRSKLSFVLCRSSPVNKILSDTPDKEVRYKAVFGGTDGMNVCAIENDDVARLDP